ncbi:MAG TPA: carboxypeptidase regulatory-like domain-containing protein [Candidatus Limnocylindrales bacterium]|nr:carboxypeptidase regulatory-like domain-containing protein [Candidatus Limnocylindrales bacterium]
MLPVRSITSLLLITVYAVSVLPLCAQNPLGSLRGTVQDSAGGRIPGATISLSSVEKSLTRTVQCDAQGEFRAEDLLPGSYQLAANAVGFAAARAEVSVAVSSARQVTITLRPNSVSEKIIVDGGDSVTAAELQTDSAVHQTVIYRQDLEAIPLAARSFANIAYLAPGTEPVEPSDPTKARITAVATGGSSGLNNEVSVDGGDNSDDYIGGFLQNFSPDAIEEFAFRTAQMDADTGRTTAGSVVITTRGGTNDWHSDFTFYERAAGLNARFPIDNPSPDPKQPFSRQNYAGTLGGPIVRDHLWFFASLEYIHENASVAYSSASREQFNALAQLASDGLIPGTPSIAVPDNVPVPFRDYLATARLDWAQSNNSHWFLRGALDTYTAHNALVQQGALPSTGATSHNNYFSLVLGQQYSFSPSWLGALVLNASGLHLTQTRNETQGFALAFPFTTTSSTITGFETYGDNQFVTGIAAFPVLRNQQKYQFRYDVTHTMGSHALRFGVNFIHEPVLSGALTANPETLLTYSQNPDFYAANPSLFYADKTCQLPIPSGVDCAANPATDGGFSQNVQRLGLYAEDSWRVTPRLTVNYGLRYDTTFGLFIASGRDQSFNPALATGMVNGIPHDYRKAFAPRLGIARTFGPSQKTVLRAGVGLYFNDLAQNGWVSAFQAVNGGTLSGGPIAPPPPALIDPNYHSPYALHATAGIQHAFSRNWLISADYTHETGMHAYRSYGFEEADVFRTDNRSAYDGLSLRLQGNVSRRAHFTAHYTLAKAQTWGCTVGELFDYVNGVCDPNDAFAPGDYGPSGEDVRHRFVLVGTFQLPGGVQLSALGQAESARPYTLTTPVGDRAVVNGVKTTLDEFRGTPFAQLDLRVSRPFTFHDRWSVTPFAEFFNLFNRNNPGNNFIPDISALPTPVNDFANATAFCLNADCTLTRPITSLSQLRAPAGALGDFFGPGSTVGIPFAAQFGVKLGF